MPDFKTIPSQTDIKELIRSAFDTTLDVSGAWGYSKEDATVIESGAAVPLKQMEHTLVSMRAYIEMNMTLPEADRYGSINVNELDREEIKEGNNLYHLVTYVITAMKESDYTMFIDAYKEGYGKEDFDLDAHFQERKEKTLTRTVKQWFEVAKVNI